MIIDPVHKSELNVFTFAGISLHSGFAEDGYVEFTFNGDRTVSSMSAGGKEVSTSLLGNRSALITITLLQQSTENLLLNELYRRDELNRSVTYSDIDIVTGGTLFLYEPLGCHIQSVPSQSMGADASGATQTWTFHCAEMKARNVNSVLSINADLQSNINGAVEAAIEASIQL